jgi:hypothetical protein
MFKFRIGEAVHDPMSGFVGIIVERRDFISGCNRYRVQPRVDDFGNLPAGFYLDEPEMERLDVPGVTPESPADPPG